MDAKLSRREALKRLGIGAVGVTLTAAGVPEHRQPDAIDETRALRDAADSLAQFRNAVVDAHQAFLRQSRAIAEAEREFMSPHVDVDRDLSDERFGIWRTHPTAYVVGVDPDDRSRARIKTNL